MVSFFTKTLVNSEPLSYKPPPFPSLYWPFPVNGNQTYYLYDAWSMWRFTVLWTVISVIGIHLVASAYAVMMMWRSWKLIWIVPIIYAATGGAEAMIAGNAVGGLLAGVYTSGSFRMSTWIPFTWGLINALVLVLASFAIQGGM